MNRFLTGEFQEHSETTAGVSTGYHLCSVNGKRIKIQIWDTAGQERFRALTKMYYRAAKGALVVYDVTNRSSFQNVEQWIHTVREGSKNDGIVILIIGNKVDLSQRLVETEEGKQLAGKHEVYFMETSAATGHNVTAAFDLLLHYIYDDEFQKGFILAPEKQTSTVDEPTQSIPIELKPSAPPTSQANEKSDSGNSCCN
eukprot:TRINITY_DN2999_c0_g6_i2.p1 TRINITY_DN2999_c0_g6~~TRINITY_DN2999_c0_g6_i2.p1  ORF type:complete len:199 (+),score=21.70 TRINITY_DN2999_c0_g6_i2:156-752(+)